MLQVRTWICEIKSGYHCVCWNSGYKTNVFCVNEVYLKGFVKLICTGGVLNYSLTFAAVSFHNAWAFKKNEKIYPSENGRTPNKTQYGEIGIFS